MFAGKIAFACDGGVSGNTGHDAVINHLFIQHGQNAWVAAADLANVGIWFLAKLIGA